MKTLLHALAALKPESMYTDEPFGYSMISSSVTFPISKSLHSCIPPRVRAYTVRRTVLPKP
ncbi:hypothetical protein IG631_23419 [Alternaria alternata]|nr:hypothetical protein IG631_23419 [Alternaria alternata]